MFAAILALGAAGFSAYAQSKAGDAAMQAAKYNNMLAQREAENQERETAESISRQRINNRRQLSTLRLRAAASGTLTTSGSTARVMEDSAGAMQVAIADAARSSAMQAESIRARGRMALWEGKQAKQAANMQAIGTVIGGLTKAAGQGIQSYNAGSIY